MHPPADLTSHYHFLLLIPTSRTSLLTSRVTRLPPPPRLYPAPGSSEYVLGTLCLPADAEAVLGVTFSPREVGRCSGLLLLSVNYNAFQRQAIRLDGMDGLRDGSVLGEGELEVMDEGELRLAGTKSIE